FGIGFVCMGIYQASIEYKNAHGSEEERMSYFDIVDTDESGSPREARTAHTAAHYCPACGEPLDADYAFCPNCGRELPR
ncbi:MAG: zinc-ribbon domain-containing protein, partial [Oscillospiraceae bacterium]